MGSCPKTVLGRPLQRIPASFHPLTVVECAAAVVTVPGKGQWLVEDQRRATRDLDPLVRDLRRPDQPSPGDVSCAAVGMTVPEILLVGRERVIRPEVPTDECGEPQKAAVSAIGSLPWTLVHRSLLRQVETPAEATSGCAPAYKDLFDLDAASFVPAPHGVAARPERGPLTVCVYRDLDPALNHPDGKTVDGADIETGVFVGWGRESGPAATSLLHGLDHGSDTTTCGSTHPAFAIVSARGWDSDTLVELGGCDRVLRTVVERAASPASAATLVDRIGGATPAAVARIQSLTSVASPRR